MMQTPASVYQRIHEATLAIRSFVEKTAGKDSPLAKPAVGVVLGSGLGEIAKSLENALTLPYSEIPHFKMPAVEGHAGKLLLGNLNGVPTVILQGRFHYYEGYSMEQVVLPVRTICSLGVHTIVLTNAAGGINTRFNAGDLMLINDHLNLMGDNPLRGPNLSDFGPRFPDLSEAYSKPHAEAFRATAKRLSMPLQEGVYAGLLGPTYETPAEVRMLRTLGADAVGMSTVPETIAAAHLGVNVCGISCITNLAAGIHTQSLNHQEVIEVSRLASNRLATLIKEVMPSLQEVTHK